jgi:uncharacterized membrane protein YfcA
VETNYALVAYTLLYDVLRGTPIVMALIAFGRHRRRQNTKWSKRRTVAAYVGVFLIGTFVGGLMSSALLEIVPPPF